MNVYSYFERINNLALPVIEFWKQSWSKHGWTPVVLGESDFKKWPRADEYDSIISKLPTINDPIYEQACYRRWGAMIAVGGGLMTDYDVINFGFTPHDLPLANETQCVLMDEKSPGVTIGTVRAFENACEAFMNHVVTESDVESESKRPHTSDMYLAVKMVSLGVFVRMSVGKEYGDPDWESAMLVHFSSNRTKSNKASIIRKALQ